MILLVAPKFDLKYSLDLVLSKFLNFSTLTSNSFLFETGIAMPSLIAFFASLKFLNLGPNKTGFPKNIGSKML